jgi:hypothetical protein
MAESEICELQHGIFDRIPSVVSAVFSVGVRPPERETAISEIRIHPEELRVLRGQETRLTAIAFDRTGAPIQGVAFEWTVTDVTRQRREQVLYTSTFKAERPGTYTITARAGENQDQGAAILLARRGGLEPLLNGDLEGAVDKARLEWASLPRSPYGQGTRSFAAFRRAFEGALANCQGGQ